MQGPGLRELHMASCIEELDKKHDISNVKERRLRMIVNSAIKLFEAAETERRRGDEEQAYVFYMKYLRLIEQMKKLPDYEKEKVYFNSMIGPKTPFSAVDSASKLKDSLISRYKLVQMAKAVRTDILNHTKDDDLESKMYSDMIANSADREMETDSWDDRRISIQSRQLFVLLNDKSVKVAVLDTRSQEDFKKSHIKFPQCINIPGERIEAGTTASKLEKNLPEESVDLWSKRASMDHIVLLDWSSTDLIPASKLHLLKTTFQKWDPNIMYKRDPVILQGGYEDWLFTYPQHTTYPHVSAPINTSNFDDLLNDIVYPENDIFAENNFIDRSNKINLGLTNKNPNIDRSSKAAAVQTYEEKARELLEKQEKVAGTSLNIEKQRVIAEQNWEELRNAESEEETKQLREQELLSEILQLESSQRDMTLENQLLREQLEFYKKREDDFSKISNLPASGNLPSVISTDSERTINEDNEIKATLEAEALAKEQNIKIIEEEKARFAKKREALQSDREKILAEAREKKKLLFKDNDEDLTTSNKSVYTSIQDMPQIDRTMKPSQNTQVYPSYYPNKQRDFQAVSGNQGQGLTGLKNLGNTCYMNSIVQCLNNTPYLNKYFREGLYREHINRISQNDNENGGTNGAVAEEVAALLQALWSGQYRFISPKDFRNVIGRYRSIFRGVEQQDSHEFLTFLMDWLHNDLQIPTKQKIHADRLSPADKAWLEYTKSKESFILKLFYGQIKSTVKCSRCGKESITYDTFSNLSLELPTNANRCSLSDCLELYLSDERIVGWNCPSCKEKRDAIKKLDISKLPPVLVVHFKRFYVDPKDYMSNTYKKKQTYINFPVKNLDMSQFSLTQDNKSKLYNLYGVSNHYGSMESGHCTAFCQSSCYSKWFKFDDHTVSDISANDVVSSAAYILFYVLHTPTE